MKTIEKSIRINASRAQLFAYLTDPNNLLEIWPSMTEVSNVKFLGGGAHTFDFSYRMAGIRLHGHAETTKVTKDTYVEVETKLGIISTFHWNYRDVEGTTEIKLKVDYEVPVPVLGKLAESFVVKMNEKECELLLSNLKERFESISPVIAAPKKVAPEVRR